MRRTIWIIGTCAALLQAGTVLAFQSPQDYCNYLRIGAVKAYRSCVGNVIAREARDPAASPEAKRNVAFARCRHEYFDKWAKFQTNDKLVPSTCVGSRFLDNGSTVTDNMTLLTWDKKTDDNGYTDVDDTYAWSASPLQSRGDGTVFFGFLQSLNVTAFGGASGWRLPTIAELQTTVLDFPCSGTWGTSTCTCPATPCLDPALGLSRSSQTYISETSYAFFPSTPTLFTAWGVHADGGVKIVLKADPYPARAVRGGL